MQPRLSVKNGSTKVIFCKDRKCFFCLRIKLILHEQEPAMFPVRRAAIFRNLSWDLNVQPLGTEPSTTTIMLDSSYFPSERGLRMTTASRRPEAAGEAQSFTFLQPSVKPVRRQLQLASECVARTHSGCCVCTSQAVEEAILSRVRPGRTLRRWFRCRWQPPSAVTCPTTSPAWDRSLRTTRSA